MKKIIVMALTLTLGVAHLSAQSWVVTRKKGKVTMEEAYFESLKQKAAVQDSLKEEITRLQKEIANQKKIANQRTSILTFNDSASYAIGRDMHDNWSRQGLGINIDAVIQSLQDCTHGQNTWSESTIRSLLNRFQQNFEERERIKREEAMSKSKDNIAEGKKFLAENAKSKGVYTTKSGLQYRINKTGNGKRPSANDRVKVHYTGSLLDGTKFDSSYDRGEPLTFPLNQVIPGWSEGVQLMDEGSQYTLYVPYNLGYGEQMVGAIPPGSTLIFEVELLEINPKN